MNDVRFWLETLGLGQYADAFEKNAIGWSLLPKLDHELLKEMGISVIGHRIQILEAAATLGDSLDSRPELTLTPSARSAEHRQLTVMFCDLVGSTALGERMDVEDYRDLLAEFRNVVVSALEEYEGFVARHQGDGLLAYFGYPQAHEDDAERSVRSGLAVVRAVEGLAGPQSEPLAVRVGIATGPVVVGDVLATGASAHSEWAALGSTPNLAARLQGEAAPNTVVISETTNRLLRGRVETARLEPMSLKGLAGTTTAYQAVRIRCELHASANQPSRRRVFIGREVELALLLDRWRKSQGADGQVVLISSEPGVGKSRLARELLARLRAEPLNRVVLQCSAYHAGTPLYPVTQALGRAVGLDVGEDEPRNLARLEDWGASLGLPRESHVPLLAPLLSLQTGESYAPLALSEEERRDRTLSALVDAVVGLAAQSPVLLLAEDLHLIDPTTEDFLGRLIEEIRDRPILALLTFRPHYVPPWRSDVHLTALTLNNLTRKESLKLLSELAPNQGLPQSTLQTLAARADGVPLFLEELSRSALEQGGAGDAFIPATLRDALTARLDRLGEAKETAQLAAVLGREFETEVLEAISGAGPNSLDTSLAALIDTDLIYRRGTNRYEFKHALIRDIAYDSLLKPRRQAIHLAAAATFRKRHAGYVEDVSERVAHHYAQAGQAEEAASFLVISAVAAAKQFAHHEAVALFGRALAQADAAQAPLTEDCDPTRIVLRMAHSRYFLGDWLGTRDTLVEQVNRLDGNRDPQTAAEWYFWLSQVESRVGGLADARAAALQALDFAERLPDHSLMGRTYGVLVLLALLSGQMEAGESYAERSIELLRRAGDLSWAGMTCHYLAWLLLTAGRFRDALDSAREAERTADAAGDARVKTYARFGQGWIYAAAGRGEEALRCAEEAALIAPDRSSAESVNYVCGWAHLAAGNHAEAARLLLQTTEAYGRFPYPAGESHARALASQALYELGRFDEALGHALRAESSAASGPYPWVLGFARRVRGLLFVRSGRLDEARRWLDTALADFERAGSQSELARSHRVLSEIHCQRGEEALAQMHQALAEAAPVQWL